MKGRPCREFDADTGGAHAWCRECGWTEDEHERTKQRVTPTRSELAQVMASAMCEHYNTENAADPVWDRNESEPEDWIESARAALAGLHRAGYAVGVDLLARGRSDP